jgi:hypothetical protein
MALKWNRHNGNWLISASRDHFCKLFDIRNLKEEIQCFRGHKKEACSKLFLFVYYCLQIKIIIKCICLILFLFKNKIKIFLHLINVYK